MTETYMTETYMTELHQNLAVARDGHLELYKSTKKYDAAMGRSQHGYPGLKELPT